MDDNRMQARQKPSAKAASSHNGGPHAAPANGKRVVKHWRDSVRYVRALAEYGRLPLRILHTDSSCRWANRYWLQSTGRNLDQVLGSGWLEDVHPEDRERCAEVWQTASNGDAAEQAFRQVEYRMRRANGEFAWVLELGTPRFTAQGSLGGFLGAVLGTPGRQRAEEEVRRYQARLRAAMAQLLLADEQERRSLASDLHDGLSQTLALAQIKLAGLQGAAAPELQERIAAVTKLVEQASRVTRTITFEISPPILHDLGLRAALHWLIENMRERYDLQVALVDDGHPLPLEEGTRVVLYRALRELLINASKHSHANRVILRLKIEQERLVASVEDDGVGLGTEAADPTRFGGSGLIGIHERIHHVGGGLRIESEPGKGTTVRLYAPLDNTHSS